jgi:hypothetical protein
MVKKMCDWNKPLSGEHLVFFTLISDTKADSFIDKTLLDSLGTTSWPISVTVTAEIKTPTSGPGSKTAIELTPSRDIRVIASSTVESGEAETIGGGVITPRSRSEVDII